MWIIAGSFSTLCTVWADLSETVKDLVQEKDASSQVSYRLDYHVVVLSGLTELQAYLGWKTRVSRESLRCSIC